MREERETTETLVDPIQNEEFGLFESNAPSDGVCFGEVHDKIAPSVLASSLLSDQEQLDPRVTENKNIPIHFPLSPDEEKVDEITRAVRERILAEQRRIIAEYLNNPLLKDPRHYAKFVEDEENKRKVYDASKDPQVKATLEAKEIEGYEYVHTNFAKKWEDIIWKEGQTIIKDPGTGKDIITLQSLESPPPPMRVKKSDGTEVTIHKYRKIEVSPLKLNPEDISASIILSLDLRDQNGKYLGKDNPLRSTIHYNEKGQLIEFSSPLSIRFNNNDPNAIGYFEHGGKIITTGIDQKTYKAIMQEVAKNRGHSADISQVVEVPAIEQKQHPLDLVSSVAGAQKTFPVKDLQDMGNDLNSKPAVTPEELARILKDMGVGFSNQTVNPNANAGKSTKATLSTLSDMGGPPAGLPTVLAYLNRGTQTEGELIKETLDLLSPEQQAQMKEKLVELKHLSPAGDQDVSTGVANYESLKKQYLLNEKQSTITNLPDNQQDPTNKEAVNSSADNQIDPHIVKPKPDIIPPDPRETSKEVAAHLIEKLQHFTPSPSPDSKKSAARKNPAIPEITKEDLEDRAKTLYAQLESAEPKDYKKLITEAISQLNKDNVSPKQQLEYLQQFKDKNVEDRQKTVGEINIKIKEGTHPLESEHPGAVELKTETRVRAVDADDGFPTVIRTQQNTRTQEQVGKVGGIKLQTIITDEMDKIHSKIRNEDKTHPKPLELTPINSRHVGKHHIPGR